MESVTSRVIDLNQGEIQLHLSCGHQLTLLELHFGRLGVPEPGDEIMCPKCRVASGRERLTM